MGKANKFTDSEQAFYQKAVEQFRRNVEWFSFDELVFSPRSPIYAGRRSHLEVLRDPLYLTLKDMWLQLGVRQGMIARRKQVRAALRRRARSVAGPTLRGALDRLHGRWSPPVSLHEPGR